MPLLDPSFPAAARSGFGGGVVEDGLLVALAAGAAAAIIAGIELIVHAMRDRRHRAHATPVMSALFAQQLYARALYGIAPPLVAALVTLLRTDTMASAAFMLAATGLV